MMPYLSQHEFDYNNLTRIPLKDYAKTHYRELNWAICDIYCDSGVNRTSGKKSWLLPGRYPFSLP